MRAIELRGGGYSRNAILDRLSLAEAYLTAHELTLAADATREALDLSANASSRLVNGRLLTVSGKLRDHSRDHDVADLVHTIEQATERGTR
jgi:hypothetical protein